MLVVGLTALIRSNEGVFYALISVVGWHMDGGERAFSLGPARSKQSTRRPRARYLGHEKRQDLILHNLDQEGIW
jgi:hypothetical protein